MATCTVCERLYKLLEKEVEQEQFENGGTFRFLKSNVLKKINKNGANTDIENLIMTAIPLANKIKVRSCHIVITVITRYQLVKSVHVLIELVISICELEAF